MPRFSYIAASPSRKTEKGILTAESAFSVWKHLLAKGLHPTDAKESMAIFIASQKTARQKNGKLKMEN